MTNQTYASVSIPSLTPSQNLNTIEPDQVEGVPTSATEVKTKELMLEQGGTGTTIVGGFLSNQDYNPEFTGTKRIAVFDEMRLSDATVRAGLNMVKLPLLSTEWYIKDPNGSEEPNEPTLFVDKQLFHNPNFSWTAFLRQALTMCENGNALFEKVFETMPDGKIGWKKFAPRLSKTIYRWTLNDGVTPGIYQILPTGKNAEIPRWKLLYFINEQEGSNYEGQSLLRAAYKHYYFKNLYYKIDSMAAEKQGMGVPQITTPNQASQADKAKAREVAMNMRANEKAYHELPVGFKIDFLDTHANTLKDSKDMIEHHDREISKAFLAQFMELGVKQGGSYALSTDQSKIFMLGLEYLAKIIQEELNKAIKELVDLNFPGMKPEDYPTLEYGSIGDVDYKSLAEALKNFTDAKLVTPTFDIEKHILASMKLPIAEDLLEQREEQQELLTQPLIPADGGTMPLPDTKAKPKNTPPKPTDKTKPEDEEVDATEFMQDLLSFSEDLAAELAKRKEEHAPIV